MFNVKQFPKATTQPPWGWGNETNLRSRYVDHRLIETQARIEVEIRRLTALREMEKLGVPAIANDPGS